MKLYHASVEPLKVGRVITANRPGSFYPEVVAELEKARPPTAPSRSICVFAADSPVKAARFMQGQTAGSFHIYEVEMSDFWKGPICIVHEIDRRMKSDASYKGLVEEYWTSQPDWRFFEYFGPEFKILSAVPMPDEMEFFRFQLSYEADTRAVKSMHLTPILGIPPAETR